MREPLRQRLRWVLNGLELDDLARRHPLRYLFFEVTRRCNLKCVYCGSSCTPEALRQELPTREWIDIARQVAADFRASSIMVALTGGEPLLKPDLFGLLRELRRLGFRFGMVTNGLLLDRAGAADLVACGLGSISLSLDAPPAINDLLRGAGSTRRVEAAIEHLRAAGYRGKLEVISTITRPAVAHLDGMRRYLAELRVPSWRVAPLIPIGRAATRPDLWPGPEELRELLEFVRSGRRDRRLPPPEFSEEGYLGARYEGAVRPYLCECRAGLTTAGILHDGRIGACPELADCFVQGHIATDRLRTVWEERYRVFRDRTWTRRGQCSECASYSRCRGGSLHLYSDLDGEPLRCLYLMLEATRAPEAAGASSPPTSA